MRLVPPGDAPDVLVAMNPAALRSDLHRLRSEHGSMMTTLVFILISTFVAAGVMAFYLMRSTNDYATEKQAQVKSAISQLSSKLLGEVNADFPEQWQYLSAEDLKAQTLPLGEAPELQANAHLGYFSLNPDTGVIVAEVIGQSTTPGGVRVIAEVKFTPSGAGVFRGTDSSGRPTWIYSDDNLDGLALWEMAPNAVQYINSGGDYVAEAPAQESGIDAEIIDLRSLWPLDLDSIVASVQKTGRCAVVHEATRTSGFGAELVALVQEHCFYHLEAPIERVTGWDTPYPHAQEWAYFPGPRRVAEGFKRAMEGK
mgnify:CR=1 FL=1